MSKLQKMIRNNENKFEIIGKIPNTAILQAEHTLGINFGTSLKNLMLNYGCISYEYFEIFGLGVNKTSHLNIVSQTLDLRKNSLPNKYIVFLNLGDGHYAVTDNNNKVYEFSINQEKALMLLNNSFDDYLVNLFNNC